MVKTLVCVLLGLRFLYFLGISMDADKSSSSGRKHRFTPKVPSQRKTRSTVSKKEKAEEEDDLETKQQLLQRFSERGNRTHRPKVEDKVQPTFIHGAKRATSALGSIVPNDGSFQQTSELELMDLDDSIEQSVSSLSVVGPSALKQRPTDASVPKSKEYREPWNYESTYYPTTLPWRRPYSGDPDILDEAEFGEGAMYSEYQESTLRPATELGFLNPDETSENVRLLFLQFPPSLPAIKRSASVKGKEIEGNSGPSGHKVPMTMNTGAKRSPTTGTSQQSCSFNDLSAGQMGKLLVYKSGAVKLKLGEFLYDVSPGSDCSFAQDAVAFNTKQKDCCCVRSLDKRAIVTPDIESLLNSVTDL
ncbi:DNA-directed RNA polymerase III subunit rpc4-like [Amaranthus tricolor]|uniref:DNA-directed RNA polymerase III subunit rpc4-like n=1 Tax=Amaranthus tricolor TaxID=29722 RepID=UPI002586FB65|nr:DNA-directed RNA polymerase III subunit rpc4-like [Amaranthus tricolor]